MRSVFIGTSEPMMMEQGWSTADEFRAREMSGKKRVESISRTIEQEQEGEGAL
jgi:hypothetical protein